MHLTEPEEKQLQASGSLWLAHIMPPRQQHRSRILFFNFIIYYYYYFVIRTPKTRATLLANFKVYHAASLAIGTMPYSRPLGLSRPAKLKLCILSLTPPFLPPPDKYVIFKFSVCYQRNLLSRHRTTILGGKTDRPRQKLQRHMVGTLMSVGWLHGRWP